MVWDEKQHTFVISLSVTLNLFPNIKPAVPGWLLATIGRGFRLRLIGFSYSQSHLWN